MVRNLWRSIVKYNLFHHSYAPMDPNLLASIICYDSNGKKVLLWFRNDQTRKPSIRSDDSWDLYYGMDRLEEVIQTLRYEKPLSAMMQLDDSGIIKQAYICTSDEPAGEQEGV